MAALALVGCKQGAQNDQNVASVQGDTSQVAEKHVAVSGKLVGENEYQLGGNTYTSKGDFSAEEYNANASGVVTFTGFPASYDEFADLYKNFLGKTPQGTVALATMAMEIYFRDAEAGEKCVNLLCSSGCAGEMKRGVGEKVRSWKQNDKYGQRYLPAAVLKGASAENGYQPQSPYTIEMKASVNKHEKVQISDLGTCLYIYVMGDGWDSHQRPVQVFLPEGGDHYKMWSASALYMQCKNTGKEFVELK